MFAAKLDLTPTLINERQHQTRNYKRHEQHQSNVENIGREHRLIFGRSPRTLEPRENQVPLLYLRKRRAQPAYVTFTLRVATTLPST
jgi:hypothetical protein